MSKIPRKHEELIRKVDRALLKTSRFARYTHHKKHDNLLKIRRGYYLNTSILDTAKDLIERRLIIFIAQCLIVCDLSPEHIALTHEAALAFLNIPILELPREIRLSYRERRWRLRTPFPTVTYNKKQLAPSRVARFHRDSTDIEYQQLSSLNTCTLRLTCLQNLLLDLALQGQQRSAFASSCLLLRGLLHAPFRSKQEIRQRTVDFLNHMGKYLENKHCRPPKSVASQFCQHLDPNIESLPEGALLWDLHANQATRWELQYTIHNYRADFCFPDERFIVEVEGASKLGISSDERHRSAAKLINRSSQISNLGFSVIALSAADIMFKPQQALHQLKRQAPELFPTPSSRPRWCRSNPSSERTSRSQSVAALYTQPQQEAAQQTPARWT